MAHTESSDPFDRKQKIWIRKLGLQNPDFWILKRNEFGDHERVASASSQALAEAIAQLLQKKGN